MKEELRPLLIELCHIAVTRNEINTRRHRARYRKNYYANALKVIEAHYGSNSELRKLEKEPIKYAARIAQIKKNMKFLRCRFPNPSKWHAMGLHKLRSLVLQATGEYALAKHETMEFSINTRDRVREITRKLKCNVAYENGSITAIHFPSKGFDDDFLDLEDITYHSEQYELDQAIESMVESDVKD